VRLDSTESWNTSCIEALVPRTRPLQGPNAGPGVSISALSAPFSGTPYSPAKSPEPLSLPSTLCPQIPRTRRYRILHLAVRRVGSLACVFRNIPVWRAFFFSKARGFFQSRIDQFVGVIDVLEHPNRALVTVVVSCVGLTATLRPLPDAHEVSGRIASVSFWGLHTKPGCSAFRQCLVDQVYLAS